MTDFDPRNLADQFAEYGQAWAEKKHAADLMQRTLKKLKARIALEKIKDAGSAVKADMMAEASEEYDEECKLAIDAQHAENVAWIKFEQVKCYIDLLRTAEATNRAVYHRS